MNFDSASDTEGRLQDSGADGIFQAQLKNFWNVYAQYAYDRTRFNLFTPNFARLPGTRVYIEPREQFQLSTNQNRPLFFSYTFVHRKEAEINENLYGREVRHQLGMLVHLFGRTKVQFSGIFDREFLMDHTPFQDRRLYIARLNHQFTTKWRARTLAQFENDRHGHTWNINSIIAYDFTARSAFIVGYNYQRSLDVPGASPIPPIPQKHFGDLGNEFFAKFSYLFHF